MTARQNVRRITKIPFLVCTCPLTAGKGGKPITYGVMRGLMKLLLPMCGMTAEDAGCHSFRRGTATGLAHINAPSYVAKGIDWYMGQQRVSGIRRRYRARRHEASDACHGGS